MSGAVTEAGTLTRMETCPVHNIPFGQIFFQNEPVGFWIGRCPECESGEKRDREADEFLLLQKDEIVKEATATIQQREHQTAIEKRTKKDLAADVSDYEKLRLPLWKDYNTNLEWNEIVVAIEDRKRTEFMAGR